MRKVLIWRWMVLVTVLMLAGCGQESVRALKVATNQWIGYEPLYLARYIGAYEQNVDIIQLPSATDVMRALRNGNVDVVATTLDEALLMASQGEDLVVLLAFDFSNGADVILAHPEITTLQDIKGKRVGVENTGLGAVMLTAALDYADYKAADINLVNIPMDSHEQAYIDNLVDVVVTFEPVATRLREAGAHQLFDSSAIPGLIVDVLVVRYSALERNQAVLRDLVQGYYRARQYMADNPQDALGFIGRRMKLSPEELQAAYLGLRLPSLQDNIQWMQGSPSTFDTTQNRLEKLMRERQLLDHSKSGQLRSGGRWLEQVIQ